MMIAFLAGELLWKSAPRLDFMNTSVKMDRNIIFWFCWSVNHIEEGREGAPEANASSK